jgi:hypothetical protein
LSITTNPKNKRATQSRFHHEKQEMGFEKEPFRAFRDEIYSSCFETEHASATT